MSLIRRTLSVALVACLVGLGLAVPSVEALTIPSEMPQPPTTTGYYTSSFDPTIYQFTVATTGNQCTLLTYSQWRSAGSPSPQLLDQVFWQIPGFQTVYVSTDPCGYGPNPEPLTYSAWHAAGSPKPSPSYYNADVVTYASNTSQIFDTPNDLKSGPVTGAPGTTLHRLSYGEWSSTGRPEATQLPAYLFKLTWYEKIYYDFAIDSGGQEVSYSQWTALGSPTPEAVRRIPGDRFTVTPGSPTITYALGIQYWPITYAQWQAAGSPTPIVCAPADLQCIDPND